MPDSQMPLGAVLFDADNIPAKFSSAILKEISSFCQPGLRRVYGDWSSSNLNKWRPKINELGLAAFQATANIKNKNATDIGLVIDAMDILHAGKFDVFVLVSSDSDFTMLANRIREQGVDVVGIGEAKTPVSLRNAYNRFILVENLLDEPLVINEPDDPKTEEGVEKTDRKQTTSKAVPLVIRAMRNMNQEEDWYFLGALGQHLVAENPDFDSRTYGSQKLSDLLRATGMFDVENIDGSMKARRKQ